MKTRALLPVFSFAIAVTTSACSTPSEFLRSPDTAHNQRLAEIALTCETLQEEFKTKHNKLKEQQPIVYGPSYTPEESAVLAETILTPIEQELSALQVALQGYTTQIKQSYRPTFGIMTNEGVYYDALDKCHPFR